jgi:hypothetical protein
MPIVSPECDRTPPVFVTQERMAALHAQNAETCLRERANEFGARDTGVRLMPQS